MNNIPFFLCLCFFALAVEAFAQTKLPTRLGTANPIDGRFACLAIPNTKLKPGEKIQVVLPDRPQKVKTAVIESKEVKSCSSEMDIASRISFYRIKISNDRDINYGIGVIGVRRIKVKNGVARSDINNDGKLEYFRSCTSREGFHSTVWTGKPLKGKCIWHTYYYLGYDTEPDCKKKEYQY
ncbi:MAG: hypothetical protein IPL32_09540 [Chloracidobacterium sp.]|nr:hypothetical protein [Chloracidobacterium sp.]